MTADRIARLIADLNAAIEGCPVSALPDLRGALAAADARLELRLRSSHSVAQDPPREPTPRLLDARQMAQAIGMSVFWVRAEAHHHRLPHHRAGRKLLFDPAEVVPAVKALASRARTTKTGAQDERSWVQRQKKRRVSAQIATTLPAPPAAYCPKIGHDANTSE